MKIRTPDSQFNNLSEYPFLPNYFEMDGMRVHYIDEGDKNSEEAFICFHGSPSWSYVFRKLIPILSEHQRTIALDFIGFGRSDKFTKKSKYSYDLHHQTIVALMDLLSLKKVSFVMHDLGGTLGLYYAVCHPETVKKLVIISVGMTNEQGLYPGSPVKTRILGSLIYYGWMLWSIKPHKGTPLGRAVQMACASNLSKETIQAYSAAAPGPEYRAGICAFPWLLPRKKGDPWMDKFIETQDKLSKWKEPVLLMYGEQDWLTIDFKKFFYELIPGAQSYPQPRFSDAGFYLPEDSGEEAAYHIIKFMKAK